MFPKRCSCGRAHDAADWTMLHLVGWQTIGDERLELRNCAWRARSREAFVREIAVLESEVA